MGCIRVTHPCATLTSPKGRLPFDLHVLGLPLAFILSQDQTLHCILLFLFYFSVLSWRIHLFSSLFGILGSLPFRLLFIGSLLSKNFHNLFRDCGLQRYGDFYFCQEKNENFLKYFFIIEYQCVVIKILEDRTQNSLEKYFSKACFCILPSKILRQIARNEKNLFVSHLHFDHSYDDKIDKNAFCRFSLQM